LETEKYLISIPNKNTKFSRRLVIDKVTFDTNRTLKKSTKVFITLLLSKNLTMMYKSARKFKITH